MKREDLENFLIEKGYTLNRWGSYDKQVFNKEGQLEVSYRYKLSSRSFTKWVKRSSDQDWHRLNAFKTWYYGKLEIKNGKICHVKA